MKISKVTKMSLDLKFLSPKKFKLTKMCLNLIIQLGFIIFNRWGDILMKALKF